MQKLFKKITKRIQRLIENVRKGNILDIALFGAGIALVIAIIIVIIVLAFSTVGTDAVPGQNTGSQSYSATGSSVLSTVQSTVNPFGQSASGSSSQGVSSSSQSSSSSVSSASSSSQSTSQSTSMSSSASASTSISTSASTSTSTSTSLPHTHSYSAWVRLVANCEPGLEEMTCTTCTPETDGHRLTRAVLAIEEHHFGPQEPLEDEETGEIVGFKATCSNCGAIWEEYYSTE